MAEELKAALEDKKRVMDGATKILKEIHTKRPYFVFELIQNAEDNEYAKGIKTKIRFVVSSDYICVQNSLIGLL